MVKNLKNDLLAFLLLLYVYSILSSSISVNGNLCFSSLKFNPSVLSHLSYESSSISAHNMVSIGTSMMFLSAACFPSLAETTRSLSFSCISCYDFPSFVLTHSLCGQFSINRLEIYQHPSYSIASLNCIPAN